MQSPNIVSQNIEKIAELFPNCVTEGEKGKVIDFDLLRQELSEDIVSGTKERYRLEWPGKKEAIVTANLPTTKTLRPVREDSVDFDNTENIYIEGDNLEVLKILQESYLNRLKLVYLDPPYNTGKDLIYKNDYSQDDKEYLIDSGAVDEHGLKVIRNSDTNGKYHSNWLTMMYPLLKLSRNLLMKDGLVCLAIDHFEVNTLISICDEIFGFTNRIGIIAIRNNPAGRSTAKGVSITHEYALIYGKSSNSIINRLPRNQKQIDRYDQNDELGAFEWVNFRKPGSKRIESPKMYYPIYASEIGIRIPKMDWDDSNSDWIIHEQPLHNERVIFPIDDNNKQRRWRWSIARTKDELRELEFRNKGDKYQIYLKARMPNDGVLPNTWWDDKKYSSTAYGANLLKDLFGELQVFSYPKSIYTMEDILRICLKPNDTVLDIFSGSATTAHAVLNINSKENNELKYILTQLPVETKYEGDPSVSHFKTICEIGQKRIKLASEKLKNQTGADIDYGFRVYRLDESNMQNVYYTPQEYKQQDLELFKDNVKPDRTAEDLLTQVILDWGLPLSLKIDKADIEGKEVFKVAGNSLYACFDSGVDEAFAKAIAKEQPLRIVFKDASFKDDTAKENVKQLLKQLSSETEMRVI